MEKVKPLVSAGAETSKQLLVPPYVKLKELQAGTTSASGATGAYMKRATSQLQGGDLPDPVVTFPFNQMDIRVTFSSSLPNLVLKLLNIRVKLELRCHGF